MNTNTISQFRMVPLGVGLSFLLHAPIRAFEVSSGSTGALGALLVTESTTITLPPDGILHYTSVEVREGATLSFLGNAANTPAYILATGEISIAGSVDVSGQPALRLLGGAGGPGGWAGGNQAQVGIAAGPGQGPGGGVQSYFGGSGGYAGRGYDVYGTVSNRYGTPLLVPLLGGSGGGGSSDASSSSIHFGGGGGGGGAILLASDTHIVVEGSVLSRGGVGGGLSYYQYNAGSGGAARLLAPALTVNGTVDVSSPSATVYGAGYGHGYVRLDSADIRFGPTASLLGQVSRGRHATVFPPSSPSLRLANVAGTDIPLNQQAEFTVRLPADGQTTQPVTVRAEGFGSLVAISIVLVPESGERVVIDGTIDNRVQNPATRTFNVDFPLDTLIHVHLWTQQTVRSN